jgi:hypothetical protein
MARLATQIQQSLKLQNDQITQQKMRKIASVPWQKMLPQQRCRLARKGDGDVVAWRGRKNRHLSML